jgi:hypothetical protein
VPHAPAQMPDAQFLANEARSSPLGTGRAGRQARHRGASVRVQEINGSRVGRDEGVGSVMACSTEQPGQLGSIWPGVPSWAMLGQWKPKRTRVGMAISIWQRRGLLVGFVGGRFGLTNTLLGRSSLLHRTRFAGWGLGEDVCDSKPNGGRREDRWTSQSRRVDSASAVRRRVWSAAGFAEAADEGRRSGVHGARSVRIRRERGVCVSARRKRR